MVKCMLLYILIFTSKIIEIALSTLRLIIVSNGKKKLGAILQGIITILWLVSAGVTIINVNKDILKIVFFSLGSVIGSYLGSLIEEKIALGTNMLICITKEKYENKIKNVLNNYKITTICEKDTTYSILLILLNRKEIFKVSKRIKKIDNNSILITEKAKTITNIV